MDSSMEEKGKRRFYGWVIVAASFFTLFWGVGMYTLTAGAFVVPICAELGFSRALYSFSRTAVSIGSLLTAGLHAKRLGKQGVKRTMLWGLVVYSAAFLLLSYSTRIWHFFLLGLLQGVFYQCLNFSTVGFLINLWFEDERGLASGIAYAGSGFGGSILLTAARWIVENYGWRVCYRVIAAAAKLCFAAAVFMSIQLLTALSPIALAA